MGGGFSWLRYPCICTRRVSFRDTSTPKQLNTQCIRSVISCEGVKFDSQEVNRQVLGLCGRTYEPTRHELQICSFSYTGSDYD